MHEELIPPRYSYERLTPAWPVTPAAALMADASLDEARAQGQLRRFGSRRWIPVTGQKGTGPTAANLYGPAPILGARALSALTELGIGQAVLDLAAVRLFRWSHLQTEDDSTHPILRAVRGAVEDGEAWVFQIETRHDAAGKLEVRAWIFDPAASWRPPAWAAEPHATVTLHLKPLLLPLHERLKAAVQSADPVGMPELVRAN